MTTKIINRLERSNLCLMDQNEAQRETITSYNELVEELKNIIDLKNKYIDSVELELVAWKEINEVNEGTIKLLEKENMDMSWELTKEGEK